MSFNLDPTSDGVDTPQNSTPQNVNPPNVAPSQQGSIWRGLLSGALLGLAAGSSQTGPESNAAGAIGAGIRGPIQAEQQNFNNQLQSQQNNRANAAQMTEEQRFDLEKSMALVQKLHLETMIQNMNSEDTSCHFADVTDTSGEFVRECLSDLRTAVLPHNERVSNV
jgi:hypothetical protein